MFYCHFDYLRKYQNLKIQQRAQRQHVYRRLHCPCKRMFYRHSNVRPQGMRVISYDQCRIHGASDSSVQRVEVKDHRGKSKNDIFYFYTIRALLPAFLYRHVYDNVMWKQYVHEILPKIACNTRVRMAHKCKFYVILSPVESVSFPSSVYPCYKLYFTDIVNSLRKSIYTAA